MARQRSPDSIKAEKMYIDSKGAVSLKDIAKKFKVSPGTVRSWKARYKWDDLLDPATQQEGKEIKRNVAKLKATPRKKKSAEEKAIENAEVENNGLTEKQQNFCLYFVKYWNATKAYQKAYDSTYNTAMVEGCSHLRKPKIKAEIERLKKDIREGIQMDTMAIIQKYADIAFADITDFVEFHQEEVPVMAAFGPMEVVDPDTGEKKAVTKMVNTVKFKDSKGVDGTILTEVSQGKDGARIKLADKMKALEKLERYFELLPESYKHKLDEEKAKVGIEKTKRETELVEEKTKLLKGEKKDTALMESLIKVVNEDE